MGKSTVVDRVEELRSQITEALEAGNFAEVKKLGTELDKLSKERAKAEREEAEKALAGLNVEIMNRLLEIASEYEEAIKEAGGDRVEFATDFNGANSIKLMVVKKSAGTGERTRYHKNLSQLLSEHGNWVVPDDQIEAINKGKYATKHGFQATIGMSYQEVHDMCSDKNFRQLYIMNPLKVFDSEMMENKS